jgi:soluble lytic murein transglycosylase-like protein
MRELIIKILLALGATATLALIVKLADDIKLMRDLGLPPELQFAFLLASIRHTISINLLLAVAKRESSFNPSATGALDEIGIMQVRPSTARGLGFTGTTAELFNPMTNIMLAAKLLKQIRRRGHRDPANMYSVYNSGRPLSTAPDITVRLHVPAFLADYRTINALD